MTTRFTAFRAGYPAALIEHARRYYDLRADLHQKKPYLQLHITRACQNQCDHCYYRSSVRKTTTDDMSYKEARDIVTNFCHAVYANAMKPVIDVIGGDPLLHRDVIAIIEHIRDSGASFGVKGNPYCLTPEYIQSLAGCGLKRFQLSLDGMAATHDAIRGRVGLFERTIQAIMDLKKQGISPVVRYTVSRRNAEELIDLQRYIYGHL